MKNVQQVIQNGRQNVCMFLLNCLMLFVWILQPWNLENKCFLYTKHSFSQNLFSEIILDSFKMLPISYQKSN